MNDTVELLACVLDLIPADPLPPDRPAPAWWGRAAQALFLSIIHEMDPALAERLHSDNAIRPFTASTLMGHFPERKLDPQGHYRLRFTTLTAEATAALMAAAQNGGRLSVGQRIELDYIPFKITAVHTQSDEHPWAGQTSYQQISSAHLLAGPASPRRVRLSFTSPTTFKRKGMQLPIPLPELVFGSLLTRWNAFAPIALPEETRRYADECLAVSVYHLRSRLAGTKGKGVRSGATGQVTYVNLNYDRYWQSLIGALSAYAFYAGVGAGTSMGMGQCRAVPANRPKPQPEPEE